MAFSCDTFVVLPPLTDSNLIVFGKNSDRPAGEVQEITFVSNEKTNEKVRCSHIEVDQVTKTYRCILSKPAWCWGAEIGANEHGLCIGNEAVFSKIPYESRPKALTGLDIVRLGLERSRTAREAVDVIGGLVEKYGQGGPCFDAASNFHFGSKRFNYHMNNNFDNEAKERQGEGDDYSRGKHFLVVDPNEAWTIETCDRIWVAKKIKGFYNMSNIYAIGDDYDLQSTNFDDFLQENRLWFGQGKCHFAQTCQGPSPCTDARWKAGRNLLENRTKNGNFSVFDLMAILRDDEAGICVDDKKRGVRTTSSQVSLLKSASEAAHFFTGTPNPRRSIFKPFIFTSKVQLGPLTISTPSELVDERIHPLYSAHQKAQWEKIDEKKRQDEEHRAIRDVVDYLQSNVTEQQNDRFDDLFHRAVAAEIESLRDQ